MAMETSRAVKRKKGSLLSSFTPNVVGQSDIDGSATPILANSKKNISEENSNLQLKLKTEELLLDSSSSCKRESNYVRTDGDSDDILGYVTIPSDHDPDKLTKEVPPHILYTLRGVRCYHCWCLFKGPDAVDVLVQHTKDHHPKRATPADLKMLRKNNTFDKLIQNGVRYCTCEYCKIFEMARFHNGFSKIRRHC